MSKDIFKYIEEKEYIKRKIKPTSPNKEICHKYILEEICIEKILKKLYYFENKLDIISENKYLEELKKVILKNNQK